MAIKAGGKRVTAPHAASRRASGVQADSGAAPAPGAAMASAAAPIPGATPVSTGEMPAPSIPSSTGLVAITPAEYPVEIDLAYATSNNFVCLPLYAADAPCLLHPDAAACLMRAAVAARRAGLTLKVFDAYRPPAVQEVLWRICPDPAYVADPLQGSNHSRGVAVDATLLDGDGEALDMGTGFDDMRELSHHGRPDLSAAVQRNRLLLLGIMLQAGFASLPTEWWHYELPGAASYPLVDDGRVLLAG